MDGWRDGFRGFPLKLMCSKVRGRVFVRLCVFLGCRDAGAREAFEFSSANDNPLRVPGVSRCWRVGGVCIFVRDNPLWVRGVSRCWRVGGVRIFVQKQQPSAWSGHVAMFPACCARRRLVHRLECISCHGLQPLLACHVVSTGFQ